MLIARIFLKKIMSLKHIFSATQPDAVYGIAFGNLRNKIKLWIQNMPKTNISINI